MLLPNSRSAVFEQPFQQSRILDATGKIDRGGSCPYNYVLSPSLWRHTSLASFHSSETVDVEIDKFMIAARGVDIVGVASFNTRAGIPSRPVALLFSIA